MNHTWSQHSSHAERKRNKKREMIEKSFCNYIQYKDSRRSVSNIGEMRSRMEIVYVTHKTQCTRIAQRCALWERENAREFNWKAFSTKADKVGCQGKIKDYTHAECMVEICGKQGLYIYLYSGTAHRKPQEQHQSRQMTSSVMVSASRRMSHNPN